MSKRGDEVYRVLLDEIVRQVLPPGSLLPEEEIATRLSVSRTPVRDALTRLKLDGLVAQRPGGIAVVTAIDTERTIEIFQLIDALETYMVQLVAHAPEHEEFRTVASAYRRLLDEAGSDAPDLDDVLAVNDRFDEMLAAVVSNRLLIAPLAASRSSLMRLRMQVRQDVDLIRRAVELRADECDAIADGDADAAADISHRRIAEALRHALQRLALDATNAIPRPALTTPHG
ncbi:MULTISPECIES: GntR family transcriptional regulator [unclassified Microbacterium]|uniref:GntR family transcriptional regulator n=1 Tax=unclassified Microbacterium TaxID=2609290 RepID=UPI003015FAEF